MRKLRVNLSCCCRKRKNKKKFNDQINLESKSVFILDLKECVSLEWISLLVDSRWDNQSIDTIVLKNEKLVVVHDQSHRIPESLQMPGFPSEVQSFYFWKFPTSWHQVNLENTHLSWKKRHYIILSDMCYFLLKRTNLQNKFYTAFKRESQKCEHTCKTCGKCFINGILALILKLPPLLNLNPQFQSP